MPNVMTMFDESDMLFAHDLDDREVTVEIASVSPGTLIGEKGRKARKPFVTFKGAKKKLALNKTNTRTIIKLYGKATEAWVGKLVTLFVTTTPYEGEIRDCIRIKPNVPRDQPARGAAPAARASTAPVAQVSPEVSEDEAREIAAREAEEARRG